MHDQINCPHCGQTITITDAIAKQLQFDLDKKHKQEVAKLLHQLHEKEEIALENQAKLEEDLKKEFEQKQLEFKKEVWQKAQDEAAKKQEVTFKDLQEQLKEQKDKNEQFQKQELELRKQKRELEAAKKEMELEIGRKLDEEKEKILKEADEAHRLKDLEKDKKLSDMNKQIEELKRKAEQGSQQNQGEVLELDFEKKLKETFPHDKIEPVGKGVHGADIKQIVCSQNGGICGVILWEIKQTKNWTEGWVSKLKDDLRSTKANIPVIITTVLPKELDGFGYYNGVWVSLPKLAIQLAIALRKNLLSVAFERMVTAGKGEKAELLFNYVSSHEFRQRVEALVEVFNEMQTQIIKERVAFEKSWKARESQMQRLITNTAGMYGEMQGLVGGAMPEIKGLEIGGDIITNKLESDNNQKLF